MSRHNRKRNLKRARTARQPLPPTMADVFKGPLLFLTHSIGPSKDIETWVQLMDRSARHMKPPARLDWHFAGGRVLVKYVGDEESARRAVRQWIHLHDSMRLAAAKRSPFYTTNERIYYERPAWFNEPEKQEVNTAPYVDVVNGVMVLHDPVALSIIEAINRST